MSADPPFVPTGKDIGGKDVTGDERIRIAMTSRDVSLEQLKAYILKDVDLGSVDLDAAVLRYLEEHPESAPAVWAGSTW